MSETHLNYFLWMACMISLGLWFAGDSIGKGIQRGLEAIARAMEERK